VVVPGTPGTYWLNGSAFTVFVPGGFQLVTVNALGGGMYAGAAFPHFYNQQQTVQVAQLWPGQAAGITLTQMQTGALLVTAVRGQCEQQGVQIGSALLAVGSAAVQGWQLGAVLSLIGNQQYPFQLVFQPS
jgi:hypothetical protein